MLYFGAWLSINGQAEKFLCGVFNQLDANMLGVSNTASKAQQAFEALALLIALREWFPDLARSRCSIKVRGDNLAALSLLCKMQPKSASLQIVAREIALIMARCTYMPDFVEHIPGVSNTVADTLSRKSELGKKFRLPPILATAVETHPQQRNQGWWITRRADAKSAGGVA